VAQQHVQVDLDCGDCGDDGRRVASSEELSWI